MIAAVLESVRDLRPDREVLLHTLFLVLGEPVEPAVVPVLVDYDVHTAVKRPVRYLLYPRKVIAVHGVCAVVLHHVRPGDGDTERSEALCGVALNDVLGYLNAAPGSLIVLYGAVIYPVAAGLEGVSQVDANAHLLHQLPLMLCIGPERKLYQSIIRPLADHILGTLLTQSQIDRSNDNRLSGTCFSRQYIQVI